MNEIAKECNNELDVLEKTHSELLETLKLLSEKEDVTFEEKKFYIDKMVEINKQIDDRKIKIAKYAKRSIQSGAVSLIVTTVALVSFFAFKNSKKCCK